MRIWNDFDEGQHAATVACWFNGPARWPTTSATATVARHFTTWDASHFLYLSECGYLGGLKSCAFYPLWPFLLRSCSVFTGGSHLLAGLVLTNALSLAAFCLFYSLVRERWNGPVAKWALVFLIAFPGSLFFLFLYSESVFIFLVIGLWYGLEKRRYGVAAVSAALLPMTRAVGAFAVLPIAWHALSVAPPRWLRLHERGRQVGAGAGSVKGSWLELTVGRDSEKSRGTAARGAAPSAPWLLLAAPLMGWGCYLALMWHWTGNPLEGFDAQKHWRVHSVWNLVDVPKFVVGFFAVTQWHGFTGSVLDRCMFVLLIYTLPVLCRLDKSLLVWTYWLGILPAMSGTFTSYTRFACCAFPIFIALGAFLSPEKANRSSKITTGLRWGLLLLFAVLHVLLVWRFVNFRWAG
ncbi:MAG: hypothetical protein HS113_01640 [Verrucomicrobiales bacterium]|nr:hypothetical protein [Verrucomicrobiales bacterium]